MYDADKAHYVVATAIIVKDGKYLIAKRASHEDAFPNKWTVPGGKLEASDYSSRPKDTPVHWYNVLEALVRREVREEVGLEIKSIQYLTSLAFVRPDNIPVLVVSLYANPVSTRIVLCPDLTDHAWVSLEEAKKYDLIEGIFEELEMLDARLKGVHAGEWKKTLSNSEHGP
ncbi:MAG: NUDIX domain-containing protein [Candidatus Diapherotrites archaeon]|nr:NUDIX domain-containing protein [Candidatus Diapherotrites archaeon]